MNRSRVSRIGGFLLTSEEAARGEKKRERETVSHVDRVSLPQGPLVSNLLRFQKIVRPGWLFDVVGMTLTKRGGKKKKRKGKKRKGGGKRKGRRKCEKGRERWVNAKEQWVFQ